MIFIILMTPPLARARNSFSSDVAEVTRYKADKSKLQMVGLRQSWVSKNLRLHFSEKIWSTARKSRYNLKWLRQETHQTPADWFGFEE